MKQKHILSSMMLLVCLMAQGAAPSGYYSSLDGLTGSALRKAAKSVVRSHTVVSYGDRTWDAFEKTDVIVVDGRQCWYDMYSSERVPVSSGHPGLNIEHSVANSWWGGSKNDAYKDLFHLNPSNSNANSRKGNYPLGVVGTKTWTNDGTTTVGHPVSGQGGGNNMVYEPCDEYKGDFARVFMYMFTVYDDINWQDKCAWMYNKDRSAEIFQSWAIDLLLKWHRQDPVSEKEKKRNEAIYGIQHNRNPYIDMPELAEYVWGSKKGEGFKPGEVEPGPVDPVDPVDPTDPDDPQPGVAGTWSYVDSMNGVNEEDSYLIVAQISEPVAMSTTFSGSSNTYAEPTAAVSIETVGGVSTIRKAPANAAVIRFEELGAGKYAAKVYDANGNQLGYFSANGAKKVALSGQKTSACEFTLAVSASEASFYFGDAGSLRYNSDHPRFTTYTTGQHSLQLYRLNKDTEVEVTELIPDAGETHIYTLQGVYAGSGLEELPKGVYIVVREGEKARKVIK